MNGLVGYPRSYGTALPQNIVTALLNGRFIDKNDVYLRKSSKRQLSTEGLGFLQSNSFDPNHQPGAVNHSMVDEQPHAQLVQPPPSNVDAIGFLNLLININSLDKALETFQGQVTIAELPAGTKLYRVVGIVEPTSVDEWKEMQSDPRRTVNHLAGSYWTYEELTKINSEAEWRGRFAVKTQWNGDHGYVEYVLEKPQYVLLGVTRMQSSADPNKVFPGGGIQIFVPVNTFDPTKGGMLSNKDVIQPFPWSNGK